LNDEACIDACERDIATFLEDFLMKANGKTVHVMAHSMGNRGLVRALHRIQADNEKFGQVIFAAPDVDSQLFLSLGTDIFGPAPANSVANGFTIYSAEDDKALGTSSWRHGKPTRRQASAVQ
jgi:esterase/lipase superfamily enzyme